MKTNYFTVSLRLFVTIALLIIGVKGAAAQTAITDLNDLSDDKVYWLSVPRPQENLHFVLSSTHISGDELVLRCTAKNFTDTGDSEKFALLKSPTKSGVFYLFNFAARMDLQETARTKRFVSMGKSTGDGESPLMLDTPDGGFRIEANTTGGKKSDYPWLFKADRTDEVKMINVSGTITNPKLVINSWTTIDDGNQFKIVEAGTITEEWKTMRNAAFEKIYAHEQFTPSAAIENGCFYTIAGGIDKDYKYLSAHLSKAGTNGEVTTPGFVVRKQESDDLLSRLWRFETSGEGNKIISANFNRGISGTPQDASNKRGLKLAASDADASVFTVDTEGRSGYIRLTCGENGQLNVTTNSGTDEDIPISGTSGRHIGYIDGAANKSAGDIQWKLTKVTTIPVTIQASAEYASVGYPFAVQVPEGVTAYYATSTANNILTLEEITSKVIPANQGALLYKQGGGEVSLTIVPNSTETLTNENLLIAATARREGYTAGTTYMLALSPSTNKAAFLKSNLTVVPQNKAYLNRTSEQAAEALEFNVTPAGIDELATPETLETEYYDLQGRRVLYPANGIFVTGSGRKVFIK